MPRVYKLYARSLLASTLTVKLLTIRFYLANVSATLWQSLQWPLSFYCVVLLQIRIKHDYSLALFLAPCAGGEKRAWYSLFMHALSSLGNLHISPKTNGNSVYLLHGYMYSTNCNIVCYVAHHVYMYMCYDWFFGVHVCLHSKYTHKLVAWQPTGAQVRVFS